MANKNENLENQVKDENNVTPEADKKPEEQKGEPEVKKDSFVWKQLKKIGNAFVTFPKKHPVITTGVVSIGTTLVGLAVADKAKEYKRDHYLTLPMNDAIDTTFKPVPEDLPAPETIVDDQIHEAFVDTVNQVMDNPEIRTF